VNSSADPRRSLWALVLIAPAPSVGAFIAFWLARGTPLGNIAYLFGKAWLYGLPLIWLLRIERRKLGWSPPRRGGFGVAALLGVLIGGAIWGAYALFLSGIDTGVIRQVAEEADIGTERRYILASLWLIVVNAPLEEYAFRWFIFSKARDLASAPVAIVISALIFTAHHVIILGAFFPWDVTVVAAAGVFVGGLVWSWCYHRFASIWPGALSHAIVDVAILAVGWQMIFG